MIHRAKKPEQIRCAIYCRKSTQEGLEQEFNSLDAQRESAEAFIASQQHEGWTCIAARYDDGGYSGGNTERPALRRLMADIEDGRVDCIVVYKVDRLSRSLLDFSRMMETFDRHDVSFVSVTQQFNTTHSMGRLTLNILLSFAQFEREIISERTRDKMAAARRKGRYVGGPPILGYDIAVSRLVINQTEAPIVRQIFELYLKTRSTLKTAQELNHRGWRTKTWTTKKGTTRGGATWNKNNLGNLLTNVSYIGKVRYQDQVYDGLHEGIVAADVFEQVQQLLAANRGGRSGDRNKHAALLRGLLHCTHCDCSMTHSYTQKGNRRYRYYVCARAQKQGWDNCPAPSLAAGDVERFVVDEIKSIGRDPDVVAETVRQVAVQAKDEIKRLAGEHDALRRQLVADNAELGRIAGHGDTDRLADLQDRIGKAERRVGEIDSEMAVLADQSVSKEDVARTLAEFDAVWDALTPREQARVIELLIERIDFDGKAGELSITFRPTGIKTLGEKLAQPEEVAA